MNRHSILLKIGVSFFIAIIAITLLFNIIVKHEYAHEKEMLREHYHHMAMAVMKWKMGRFDYPQLLGKLKKNKITLIQDEKLHQEIERLVTMNAATCAVGDNFYVYEKDSYRYVVLPPIFGKMLLKDENVNPIDISYVWWLYGAFLLIVLFLFTSILISLYPLKRLQQQIHQFGEGQTDIDFSTKRKDEIAEVSNEFNNAVNKINNVLEARKVFLRNISHELKTPVTSGKLALELLDDSQSKEVLKNVFTRLELLLKEFIQIEKITATESKLETKEFPLTEILDQATDLLFLQQNSIKNNFTTEKINVNFELFTLVLKNLIDNGLKYSQEKDFYIELNNNQLNFISRGETMEEPLEHYLQPFVKSDDKTFESFGLGLYVVDAILKKHEFTFTYTHKDGYNYFIISNFN